MKKTVAILMVLLMALLAVSAAFAESDRGEPNMIWTIKSCSKGEPADVEGMVLKLWGRNNMIYGGGDFEICYADGTTLVKGEYGLTDPEGGDSDMLYRMLYEGGEMVGRINIDEGLFTIPYNMATYIFAR